jgi:hypothetical protein
MGETWEERGAMWGKVVASAGVGLGCAFGFTQAHDCGVVCGHIDGYRTLWPDVSHGYITDEEVIDWEGLLNMADGKYIALTTLDMGDHLANPGEEVELADEIAEVLLKKRAVEPAGREKKFVRSKYHGTNN